MTLVTAIAPAQSSFHVLLVASDPWQAQHLELALTDIRGARFDVCRRPQIGDAKETLLASSFDAVVLHSGEVNETFLAIIADLKQHCGGTPVIVVAGEEEEALAIQAVDQGAESYLLESDLANGALAWTIEHAITRRRFRTENDELSADLADTKAELKRTSQRLSELSEASNSMTGGLSHEFRTPLTVVQEYCALVRDGLAGPVTAEQCRYLDIATDRVGDLNRMLNDFVDSLAAESGTIRLRRKPARLVEIINDLEPQLKAKAAIRQARLEIWVSADLPQVFCDAGIVSRVICNLVTQALKSIQSEGAIRIWADRATDQRQVVIAVTDNGVGAAPKNPDTILRELALAKVSPSVPLARGTFGVAMTQKLVQANLGDFGLHCNPLHGTTYLFTLPEVESDVVMAAYLRNRQRSGESPSAVALVLVSLDEEAGSAVAHSLDDVLFEVADSGDLVLRLQPFVWALIVDASWQQAQLVVARVQDAWAQANRGKRIKQLPEILVEVKALYHFNSQDREKPMPTAASSSPAMQEVSATPHILLVDDDRSIVEALRLRLKLSGYDVSAAHDGRQGLEAVAQHRPDLILLDIRMPIMDGLTMLASLQKDDSTRHIPVVIVSASHDDRQRALELGARYFIEKPYDPNVLKVTIGAVLQRSAPQECSPK